MNKKNDGWTELSNALSFGGSTARPQKRTVVKQTKEESDAMWRRMSIGEMKELARYMSEEDKDRLHQLRFSFRFKASERGRAITYEGVKILSTTQAYQEAMIVLQDEKEASE